MANKWLKLLLAASIAFNIAFFAGNIYRNYQHKKKRPNDYRQRTQPHPKGPGLHFVKNKLNLDVEQKKQVGLIMKRFRMTMLQSKHDILNKRMEIIESLSDSEYDEEEIQTQTGELNKMENRLNLVFVETLIKLNEILDPRQRVDFLLQLSRNWFFMPPKAPPTRGEHDD